MNKIKSLKCRECNEEYPAKFIYICENCFGPLEVEYNYEKLNVNKNTFENRKNKGAKANKTDDNKIINK